VRVAEETGLNGIILTVHLDTISPPEFFQPDKANMKIKPKAPAPKK